MDHHRRWAAYLAGAALVLVGAGLTVLAQMPARPRVHVVERGGTARRTLVVYVDALRPLRGNQDDGVRLAETFGAELAGAGAGDRP